ncbi:MAG: hypothetical protein B6229_03605 [Spirochaetaceae bacterium 4572_7]|nr:MAG: hypothetical protein B6229_03605 [Spirochaetaceae bacterium 4572_7]
MFNKKEYLLLFLLLLLSPAFSTPNIENNKENPESINEQELTSSEYAAMFQSVFHYILTNYVDEVPADKLFEGAMTGLFNSLEDPHSTYLSKSQLLDLTDTTEGEFGGLGIHIQKQVIGFNSDNKSKELPYVKVISPISGTPAYRAGIKSRDYITQINGESTIDLSSDEVLDRLRGKPGTDVTISILRNRNVNFDVTITRAIIDIPTVEHDIIQNIGYLKISQFSNHSADQVKKVLKEFNKSNIKGLIIDVRNNPGGLLTSVVDISDFIFSEGLVVSTKSRIESENSELKATKRTIVPEDLPIAVLINGGSASASEILTGVIKDRKRGTIIGTKSFGKGSVQQMRYFGDGGFKMTVARFYTPSGVTIDKVGIEPDIPVKESSLTDLTEDETTSYIKLLTERIIGNYLLENRDVSEDDILALANSIIERGYDIPVDFLINDIRERIKRSLENPPVYDLDHDKPLIKAVELLTK